MCWGAYKDKSLVSSKLVGIVAQLASRSDMGSQSDLRLPCRIQSFKKRSSSLDSLQREPIPGTLSPICLPAKKLR